MIHFPSETQIWKRKSFETPLAPIQILASDLEKLMARKIRKLNQGSEKITERNLKSHPKNKLNHLLKEKLLIHFPQ